jgi:hypothetical protein
MKALADEVLKNPAGSGVVVGLDLQVLLLDVSVPVNCE